MEIVDAQIHEFAPVTEWAGDVTETLALEASIELAVAAMDAAGVAAAVVSSLAPTIEAYVSRYPERFAGVPYAGPQLPLDVPVEDHIARLRATPGVVGLRLIIGYPLDGSRVEQLRTGAYDPYLAAAAKNDLPVCVLLHGYLHELRPVLARHPDLTVVIDHLGLFHPPWKTGLELFDDLPDVLSLAEFPNVALKLTGAPHLSQERYPFGDLWPHLHRLIDAYGVDRLMWGSDFTRCRQHHSYREAVDYLLHTHELTTADKTALFATSIQHWLRWPR